MTVKLIVNERENARPRLNKFTARNVTLESMAVHCSGSPDADGLFRQAFPWEQSTQTGLLVDGIDGKSAV